MAVDNGHLLDGVSEAEDTVKDKYLTFEIDHEIYGIDIANIQEIIQVSAITQVPKTPSYLKGIINLRGEIIPVIDVRDRFRKQTKEYDDITCIIVIEFDEYVLGLIVDSVKEVAIIDESHVFQPPSVKLDYYNQFVRNIGRVADNKLVLLLDLEKVLRED